MTKGRLALLAIGPLIGVAVTAIIYPEGSSSIWLAVLFWFYFWLVCYLLPATLISLLFWILGRRRANWIWWEFAILIVPYIVWVAFMFINDRGKSLENIIEMFWLGCAVPLAAMIRVVIGSRFSRRIVASALIVVYSVAAVILWATVSPIPLSKN